MGKKTKTIGERLQENEEIIKELLAEGKSEREARKQLANRALEKWIIKQALGDNESSSNPSKSE